MKTIQKIVPILFILILLSSCKNEKTIPKVKEAVKQTETKVGEKVLQERLNVDYKIEHLQTLADLERIKIHFIEETNKFKLEKDIKDLKQRLAKLKATSNQDFNNSIIKIEKQVNELEKSIKNEDHTAKQKIENLSKTVEQEVKKLEEKAKAENTKLTNATKRQYEELRAKINLRKAKNAIVNNQFDNANKYLEDALKDYDDAKKYGNETYKAKITNLQNQLKTLITVVNTEKSDQLDLILINVE